MNGWANEGDRREAIGSMIDVRGGRLHRVETTWWGKPGMGSANARQKVLRYGETCRACRRKKHAKIGNTDKAKAYKAGIEEAIRRAVWELTPGQILMPRETRLFIVTYWDRAYTDKSGEELDGLPFGDIDAVEKITQDAFESVGVVRNDGQIMEKFTKKALDRDCPRVVMAMERIDEDVEPMP